MILGTTSCRRHSGTSLEKAKARGEVRTAVLKWDLDEIPLDPGDVLLRLVTVTTRRAEFYARLLDEAWQAAERIAAAETVPDQSGLTSDARRDLDNVLQRGGLAALVGHTYSASKEQGIYATAEVVRALAKLEQEERKLAADLAAKAVAADLMAKRVAAAEALTGEQGQQLTAVLRTLLAAAGLDPYSPSVADAVRASIAHVIDGGPPPLPIATVE